MLTSPARACGTARSCGPAKESGERATAEIMICSGSADTAEWVPWRVPSFRVTGKGAILAPFSSPNDCAHLWHSKLLELASPAPRYRQREGLCVSRRDQSLRRARTKQEPREGATEVWRPRGASRPFLHQPRGDLDFSRRLSINHTRGRTRTSAAAQLCPPAAAGSCFSSLAA